VPVASKTRTRHIPPSASSTSAKGEVCTLYLAVSSFFALVVSFFCDSRSPSQKENNEGSFFTAFYLFYYMKGAGKNIVVNFTLSRDFHYNPYIVLYYKFRTCEKYGIFVAQYIND
jgi:hypothetical protein